MLCGAENDVTYQIFDYPEQRTYFLGSRLHDQRDDSLYLDRLFCRGMEPGRIKKIRRLMWHFQFSFRQASLIKFGPAPGSTKHLLMYSADLFTSMPVCALYVDLAKKPTSVADTLE